MIKKLILTALTMFLLPHLSRSQQRFDLSSGWLCQRVDQVQASGSQLSSDSFALTGWMPAKVPGTILGTLIQNHILPDPMFGMNNKASEDLYTSGPGKYTYWFVKDIHLAPLSPNHHVWLDLRGINYKAVVYLNGKQLDSDTLEGMFLRHRLLLDAAWKSGTNRLALAIFPPEPAGNPNGGQGGDGEIARNVASQYTAGWDWIQPIADRNTGIWDRISLYKTGPLRLLNPYVQIRVPGKRTPDGLQAPVMLTASVRVDNPGSTSLSTQLQIQLAGHIEYIQVQVPAHASTRVTFPRITVQHPKLWWPNGMGAHPLYKVHMTSTTGHQLSDSLNLNIGLRQITHAWNTHTRSMEILVNGQKVFIQGGDWIASDELLRTSASRYDAEVRMHQQMNLNLIRIWGGSLTERPEFYDACDRYGILVMQDFWMSGDCNGRWTDPKKKEDQWTRRQYPDSHALFLASVADQIRMLRNHASLAFWCGGNEITPPADILLAMQDSLIPRLDPDRWLIPYSNSDSMSYNTLGGNGDGPYGIQPVERFFGMRSFPFNSEVGSIGMGDYASLKRFIPLKDLRIPKEDGKDLDSVWAYHKYIGYDHHIQRYGPSNTLQEFAFKAQLVNYNQYRSLMEGFRAHLWDWYTGVIIWKTQNPWTALRGQMYDYYLDPNAGLFGLHHGGEPLHLQYDPASGMVELLNTTAETHNDLMVEARMLSCGGQVEWKSMVFEYSGPQSIKPLYSIRDVVRHFSADSGAFLQLRLLQGPNQVVSENLYWFPDSTGRYSGLQRMAEAPISLQVQRIGKDTLKVTLADPPGAPLAFFNRISVVNQATGERLLPVFYSDNYISVLPGTSKCLYLDVSQLASLSGTAVRIHGWNVPPSMYRIQ